MMKSLVAVVLFLGVCHAAPLAANHSGCCFPSQFEADVFVELEVSGPLRKPEINQMMFAGSFDYKNNRIALVSDKVAVYYLLNNTGSVMYTALEGGRKCNKSPLPFNITGSAGCITKEMQFVAESYFGNPAKPLNITTYFSNTILGNGVDMSVTVTSSGCYPISDTIIGRKYVWPIKYDGLFEVISYVNTIDGIKDLDIFTLPDSCKAIPY